MNGWKFGDPAVKIYVPTNNIGIARFRHHHLLIPKFDAAFNHLVTVSKDIVKAFYDEINNCETPITIFFDEDPKGWISFQTFWEKFVAVIRIYTHGERSIPIAEYYPRDNRTVWYRHRGFVKRKEGRPRRCPDKCKEFIDIQFGPQHIIENMFHCDGHLDCKEKCNVDFIEPLMRWDDKYDYRPLLITTGLFLEIHFAARYIDKLGLAYFGIYGWNVNPDNILQEIFSKIIRRSEFQEKLNLGPTHFGYSTSLKRIEAICQTDRDPTTDFTNETKGVVDLPDGRDPHIVSIFYPKNAPEKGEIPPKPICFSEEQEGEQPGSGGEQPGSGVEQPGSGGKQPGSGGKPVSGKPVGEGSTIQSQKFPFWILIIPAVLLLLRFRKRR